MPFDSADLLRQVGYGEGETVPLQVIGGTSFSSDIGTTSFNTDFGMASGTVPPPDILAPNGQLKAALTVDLEPGSGETASVRFQNNTDGTAVPATETARSGGRDRTVWSGWADWNPPTTATPVEIVIAIKTEPGTNDVTVRRGKLMIGVEP